MPMQVREDSRRMEAVVKEIEIRLDTGQSRAAGLSDR
jgi:hypothetical protein